MVVLSSARTLAARLGDLADTTAPESAVRRLILCIFSLDPRPTRGQLWGNQLHRDPPKSNDQNWFEKARYPAKTRPAEVPAVSAYSQGQRFESCTATKKAPLIPRLGCLVSQREGL